MESLNEAQIKGLLNQTTTSNVVIGNDAVFGQ